MFGAILIAFSIGLLVGGTIVALIYHNNEKKIDNTVTAVTNTVSAVETVESDVKKL